MFFDLAHWAIGIGAAVGVWALGCFSVLLIIRGSK
jgi:hypothetical protein